MLVLTRKIGEQILIGEDIVLTVLSVNGKQVRLGFEAPRSVAIWRLEVARPTAAPDNVRLATALARRAPLFS